MDAIVAILTVFAAVAGIVQTIVTLVERSERKRLEKVGRIQPNHETSIPAWRPALISERPIDQQFVDHPSEGPHPLKRTQNSNDKIDYRDQPIAGAPSSFDADSFTANYRSSLAYLFGFIGGLIYRKSPSEKVRFHAAQSRWIDIFAVVYFVIAMILTIFYLAIRYPDPGSNQIPSGDPVMWAWTLTSLVAPPIIHIALAILTMTGRNPRVPLVWKIAATMSVRQGELLSSDGKSLQSNHRGVQEPPPERSTKEGDREEVARTHRPSSHPSPQIDKKEYDRTERPAIKPPKQVSVPPPRTEEVVQPINSEPKWDSFHTERENEENFYVAFIPHKRLYWLLTALMLILDILVLVVTLTSTSLGAKIIGGIFAAFLILLTVGFGGMAKSPIRLEIGSRGVQLFARSGTTWLPWELIEKIEIKKIAGIPHLVARLPYSDTFPDYNTFGGGPRFLPKLNAIAICSLSVIHAPRHQIVRALRTYGKFSTS